MIENLFASLTTSMSGAFEIALAAAFGWGMLSILLSPCHLTSIPLIIGYISSRDEKINLGGSFRLSLVFALGILLSIALIGFITASLGRIIGDVGRWGNLAVAAVFIVVGLYLLDLVSISWNSIGIHPRKGQGLAGAFGLGLVFGIGLGPCTFAFMAPVLGAVMSLAAAGWAKPMLLVSAFGLGHCTVITGAGTLSQAVQQYLNWTEKSGVSRIVRKVAGAFVLLGGGYFIFTMF
ncbi:MAG: cytochrome c biogenesis protein CcdA [Calditrichia bacterium]